MLLQQENICNPETDISTAAAQVIQGVKNVKVTAQKAVISRKYTVIEKEKCHSSFKPYCGFRLCQYLFERTHWRFSLPDPL